MKYIFQLFLLNLACRISYDDAFNNYALSRTSTYIFFRRSIHGPSNHTNQPLAVFKLPNIKMMMMPMRKLVKELLNQSASNNNIQTAIKIYFIHIALLVIKMKVYMYVSLAKIDNNEIHTY